MGIIIQRQDGFTSESRNITVSKVYGKTIIIKVEMLKIIFT